MNRIKTTYESFKRPVGTGADTYWEGEGEGKIFRITLNNVKNYLGADIEIKPEDIKHLLINVKRDPKRIAAANLSYPIILIKSEDEFISILDGQHRVVKAIENGVNIKAKVLDLDLAPIEYKKIFKK